MPIRQFYTAKSSGRNRVVVYEEGIKLETLKKTILIVEDENTVLKLLQDRLSNAGYNIVTTCNGKSAIRLAKEIHPDILVLDIILPDINGFEVCKEIKKDPLTQSIKIIILSKIKRSKSIVKGLHIGADDYVTKPFSMEELEARIMRILSSAG